MVLENVKGFADMPILRYDLSKIYLQIAYGSDSYTITGRDNYAEGGEIPSNPVSNFIFSGKGNDSIFGGFGSDIIYGGGGDDYIIGYGFGPGNPSAQASYGLSETGRDILDGGAGNDYLGGGGGDDILIGGTGNDVLAGSRGNDILYGGAGDDILRPGDGADILWGGSGADTFRYSYSINDVESPDASGGRDVIMDFEVGIDKLNLRGYSVKADGLDITNIDQGLLLSFEFLGRDFEIEVREVTAFQQGDIIFA